MAIQITLNANEFKHEGVHGGYEYNSLKVERNSNGRIYFCAMKNGMRMKTMAKQMKLEDGKVFVSFGKAGKLFIGTYVDTDQVIEEVIEDVQEQEVITTNAPETAWESLKEGKKVLMNNSELDALQAYVDTLSDDEQDIYYKHFASTFEKSLACGLLTRAFVCELKNYGEEAETMEDIQEALTPAQKETLAKRLNKDNVKPLRLFKSNYNDSVLLECINLNLPEEKRKPFYFIIQATGNEFGKGYDYPLNEYTLIHTYDENEQEVIKEKHVKPNQPKTERELIETISNDNYTIEVYTWLSHDDIQCYFVKVYDVSTNAIIKDMSDTVYLSREAAYKFISTINPIRETKQDDVIKKVTKEVKTVKKPKNVKDNKPVEKVSMIASYAKVNYIGDTVNVVFSNDDKEYTVKYEHRKTWSHKKYIGKALSDTGIRPAYDFKCGWEYMSDKVSV